MQAEEGQGERVEGENAQVADVGEGVRPEGVDHPGDDARPGAPGDMPGQQERAPARQGIAGDDQQVIGQDHAAGQRGQGQRDQRRAERGIIIGQRQGKAVKNGRVVEVGRVGQQGMIDPAQRPDIFERVAGVYHAGGGVRQARPGQQRGQQQEQPHAQQPDPTRPRDTRAGGGGGTGHNLSRRLGGRGRVTLARLLPRGIELSSIHSRPIQV